MNCNYEVNKKNTFPYTGGGYDRRYGIVYCRKYGGCCN